MPECNELGLGGFLLFFTLGAAACYFLLRRLGKLKPKAPKQPPSTNPSTPREPPSTY